MMYKDTLTETILKLLLYKTLSYKEVDKLIRKYKRWTDIPDSTIRNTLSRLKKKRLISKTSTGWSSGKIAEINLNKKPKNYKNRLDIPKNKTGTKIIVMYDIPEKLKAKRDLLREGLKTLDFKQKQKSVWIGPAPLPKEFIEFVKELNILNFINFLEVKREELI